MKVWDGDAKDFRSALAADADVREALGNENALDAAFNLDSYTKHIDALFSRAGLED